MPTDMEQAVEAAERGWKEYCQKAPPASLLTAAERKEAWRAALLAADPFRGREVSVRPLEWTAEKHNGFTIHVGRGLGLKYEVAAKVSCPGWVWTSIDRMGTANDEDEAKAAAQSDYETRIRSALEPGDGWRSDMENAPKDAEILVCNEKGERHIAVWWALYEGWDIGVYNDDHPECDAALAKSWTHWRPLPTPPSQESEG